MLPALLKTRSNSTDSTIYQVLLASNLRNSSLQFCKFCQLSKKFLSSYSEADNFILMVLQLNAILSKGYEKARQVITMEMT